LSSLKIPCRNGCRRSTTSVGKRIAQLESPSIYMSVLERLTLSILLLSFWRPRSWTRLHLTGQLSLDLNPLIESRCLKLSVDPFICPLVSFMVCPLPNHLYGQGGVRHSVAVWTICEARKKNL